MKRGPDTPKGFNDILPQKASIRRRIIADIAKILEKYEFVPVETPSVEFAETLLGKYGEEEKLIYQFEDRGGRKLALRYDLTVPLARFVANNPALLTPSFRRYQIGNVFRGENPQKGRSREFIQFDFDTVGISSEEEDAKIIAAACEGIKVTGFPKAKMAVNDRTVFDGFDPEVIRGIDKLYKIGIDGVKDELRAKGVSRQQIEKIDEVKSFTPTPRIKKIFSILETGYKLKEGADFFFDPTLARGLDYYTSTIMEMKQNGNPEDMSIGGGGRYDKLIGMFAGRDIPAVGFSFGIDRIVELLT